MRIHGASSKRLRLAIPGVSIPPLGRRDRESFGPRGNALRSLISFCMRAFDPLVFTMVATLAIGFSADARLPAGQAVLAFMSVGGMAAYLLGRCKGYAVPSLQSFRRQGRALLLAFAACLAVGAGVLALLGPEQARRTRWLLDWTALAFFLLAVGRLATKLLIRHWVGNGRLKRRIALIGATPFSRSFVSRVVQTDCRDTEIVGIYDDAQGGLQHDILPTGDIEDLVEASREGRVDAVVLGLPLERMDQVEEMKTRLRAVLADIYVTPDIAGLHFESHHFRAIGSHPVLSLRGRPLSGRQVVRKAIFDRLLSLGLLMALAPLLGAIALLIRLDSKGPILFRQPRMGFNNRLFMCLKFRTMYHDQADLTAERQTTRDDPRITPVGRWLRKLSLDELPQILNVLLGDMSLVGPRPHAPNTKAGGQLFHDAVEDYEVRHLVKPGITGWAQVNGWRGETRTVQQIRNRVAFDLQYIENWSLWLDIKILFLTASREIISKTAF